MKKAARSGWSPSASTRSPESTRDGSSKPTGLLNGTPVSTVDDAYYQQDCARVMAAVTKTLATNISAPTQPQQDVIDAATAALAALDTAGETAPGDLTATTDAFVQSVKDGYVAQRDDLDAKLALPQAAKDALGYDDTTMTAARDLCVDWITAIDTSWAPS